MPKVTVGRENTGDIEIYDTDQGAGQPVVLTRSSGVAPALRERSRSPPATPAGIIAD